MAERKCGVCRQTGHTRQYCPENQDMCEACGLLVTLDRDGVLGDHKDAAGRPCVAGPVSDPAPTVEPMDDIFQAPARGIDVHDAPDPAKPLPEDPFSAPAKPVEYTNASGQPRDKVIRGKYQITDPVTGEFRRFKTSGNIDGFSRCTTFIKAPTDTTGLTDWKQVNVLIGAAKRPDLAAKAWGKTWAADKHELGALVEELEGVAGAKISSGVGTEIHELTERLDAGQISLDDVPPHYRDLCAKYITAIREAGLVPVAGYIERTIMTHKYGGVAGSYDRIYLHQPSGTYVMGDVKTGKTPEQYGRDEIPAQLHIYADGFNAYGNYDWNTETWEPPALQVRTDVGIVVHMPVDGPQAWTVRLRKVSLDRGRQWAELCAHVKEERTAGPKWEDWDGTLDGVGEAPQADPDAPNEELTWGDRFSGVSSGKDAALLWRSAKRAGITGIELNRLVGLAQQRLRELGVSG